MTNRLNVILYLLMITCIALLVLAIFDTLVIGELNWLYIWISSPVCAATLALYHHIQDMHSGDRDTDLQ